MKIGKYVKGKANKYKVLIDDEPYTLYDDVIVKYNLLMKHDIDKELFTEMIKYNSELDSYYMSIKYITIKLRSELEIRNYLSKKEISSNVIDKTIKRLKDNHFLNDEVYTKAYINDQINLTNNGPKKIRKDLIKLGIAEEYIDEYLTKIDHQIWIDKINNFIEKKIRLNHNSSANFLRMKISNELINMGYDKEDINSYINSYDIIDADIKKKEYLKAKEQLSKKYSGYELDRKIKERLYRKGFYINQEDNYEE